MHGHHTLLAFAEKGSSMSRHSTTLSSSAITAATYDDDTGTLELTFTSGRSYTYQGVPQQVYDELCAAASAGTYFSQNIKGVYD